MYLNTHNKRVNLWGWEKGVNNFLYWKFQWASFFFFFGRGGGCPSCLMTPIPGVLHSAVCLCSCTAWTTHLTPNLTQSSFFPNQKSSLPHVLWSLILNTAAYTYTKCQYSKHDSSSAIILNRYHIYLNCF